MNLKIVPNWTSLNEKELFSISITQEEADKWYKEMTNRFIKLWNLKTQEAKEKYIKAVKMFDIDESYEYWQMSEAHLKEMMKFLFNF